LLDLQKQTLSFTVVKFVAVFEEILSRFEDPQYFDMGY
jgi:hypothetical protein